MSDVVCIRRQRQEVVSVVFSSDSLDLDGLIVEILARLPAKSLLRFRCVCKAWRALISESYFIKRHLICINMNFSTRFSLLTKDQVFRSAEHKAVLKCFSHDGHLRTRMLDFPVLDSRFKIPNIQIVGSCNGLICLLLHISDMLDIDAIQQPFTFMLWNPCTRESQVLPLPPFHSPHSNFRGFGYDSTTDDYKVILGCCRPGHEVVFVFTLKTGSWRKLERLNRYFHVLSVGSLVNEALHWVLEDGFFIASKLVSFDLAEEEFHEIPFPFHTNTSNEWGIIANVGTLNNCLTMCIQTTGSQLECDFKMWVLKDYAVKNSWTEVIYIPLLEDKYMYVAYIYGNGEVLMWATLDGLLALYNMKEKTFQIAKNKSAYVHGTAVYLETLVSPLIGSTVASM
ncbi:F-box/kelch-repeat protein At3g23880-like [Argentina anserina]|uniref:F-box/kelch-repeat protein At3g23880-like n=1 Tax=Argentina anserina TaxID=57926 RepID=UPI0021764B3C|nr:F-box/kelch-repeat protein At3g23880-like [Potentilla anserina]